MRVTKKDILWLLSPFLIAVYPCLYMYLNNAGEASFVDIVPISIVFLLITLLIVLFFRFITIKDLVYAVLLSNITVWTLVNFKEIESLLQNDIFNIYYWHVILIIIFILILGHFILYKKSWQSVLKQINQLIAIVYSILLIIALIPAVPQIYNKLTYNQKETNSVSISQISTPKHKHVYYIIFDEYSSFKSIKHYYDYENKELEEFLKNKKFNIAYESSSKYYFTVKVLGDLLNLEEIVTPFTPDLHALRKQPKLYNAVKEKGYKLNVISVPRFLDVSNVDYSYTIPHDVDEGPKELILNNTIFYPFVQLDLDLYADSMLEGIEKVKNVSNLKDDNIFTLAYFCFPHGFFVFNENGERNIPQSERYNFKKHYFSQYKYATKLMMNLIEDIVSKDKDAIILIQSDHSARPNLAKVVFDKQKLDEIDEVYYKSIFNVLYYKGEIFTIENLSGMDTLKKLLENI